MKKILLSAFLAFGLNANSQTTLFEDNFDSYTDFAITGFGNWSTLDLDLLNTYIACPITPAAMIKNPNLRNPLHLLVTCVSKSHSMIMPITIFNPLRKLKNKSFTVNSLTHYLLCL